MGQKPKNPGLRWRRPASPTALVAVLVAGLLMVAANMAAIATHDWWWFVAGGLGLLVFLGLTAYGLAANQSRDRAERRRAAGDRARARRRPPDRVGNGGGSDAAG